MMTNKSRIQYLIGAYQNLEYASNRKLNGKVHSCLEKAMADIQLFGTKRQVVLAKEFVIDITKNKTASLDIIIKDLRQEIRQELNLEQVESGVRYLRFTE